MHTNLSATIGLDCFNVLASTVIDYSQNYSRYSDEVCAIMNASGLLLVKEADLFLRSATFNHTEIQIVKKALNGIIKLSPNSVDAKISIKLISLIDLSTKGEIVGSSKKTGKYVCLEGIEDRNCGIQVIEEQGLCS